MSQAFILTFDDVPSYEKYKQEVIKSGGTIKNDYGTTPVPGFSAVIPPSFVEFIRSNNLVGNSISTFDPDGVATIQ